MDYLSLPGGTSREDLGDTINLTKERKEGNGMRKEYTACYSESADMTFIVCDEWNGDKLIATEVVGFYFGIPTEKGTEMFIGDLRAEFD